MNRHFDYLPDSIKNLPRDKRGYPVPYFASEVDGEADFVHADPVKFRKALKENRCWICGGHLGRLKTFVLGPMCCVTRTTSEPPCHRECAEFAVKGCPFLSKPMAKRSENEGKNPGGIMIKRNPGVAALWGTMSYEVFQANGILLEVGDPVALTFWSEGRPATRDEVTESITSGSPALAELAHAEGPEAVTELMRTFAAFRVNVFDKFMPKEKTDV
jgi:hypothetical protein